MVEVQPVTCPKCGALVRAPANEPSFFCLYCGAQLFVGDGSQTVTYRMVDEARIRLAEINDARELRTLEIEERRRPGRIKATIALALIGAVLLVIGTFTGNASGDPNSPWYMLGMIGMFAFLAIPWLWIVQR